MQRFAIWIRADIQHHARACGGGEDGRDGGTFHPSDSSQAEQRGDHARAGVARGHEGVRFAALDQVNAHCHRIFRVLVTRLEGQVFAFVFHRQYFGRVDDADGQTARVGRGQCGSDFRFVPNENNFNSIFSRGHHRAFHVGSRVVITSHGVNDNAGHNVSLFSASAVTRTAKSPTLPEVGRLRTPRLKMFVIRVCLTSKVSRL